MNLITLDFGTIAWVFLALVILGIAHRFVWWLAQLSDGLLGILTRLGLRTIVRTVLTILLNYDQRTYVKSRFNFWNQVPFRFAIFWSVTFGLLVVLGILKMGHSIHSISQTFGFVLLGYLAYQCFRRWIAPRQQSATFNSSNPDVKEQLPTNYSLIRRWDYLDELFARRA